MRRRFMEFQNWVTSALYLLIAIGVTAGQDGCNSFRSGVICPLNIDNVLNIDGHTMDTEQMCQYTCFRDKLCSNFTFFDNGSVQKCVLFKECPTTSPCVSCFTGPIMPSLGRCREMMRERNVDETTPFDESRDRTTSVSRTSPTLPPGSRKTLEITPRDRFNINTRSREAENQSDEGDISSSRRPKQLDDRNSVDNGEDVSDEDDEDVFSVEGIDDGLLMGEQDPVELPEESETVPSLPEDIGEVDEDEEEAFPDEYFEEESQQDDGIASDANGNRTRGPHFFHCVVGGYGPRGPNPTVSHLVPTRRTRSRLIPPLPSRFPLGYDGMFSTMMGLSLVTCSPGTRRSSSRLFGAFAPTASLVSGQCVSYANPAEGWKPMGSPMNTYRGGGTVTKMGRFIVATGGRGFPSALDSIEVLNTRKPGRWRTMSKLTLPNPTFDHCAVAVNNTAMLVTGGAGQEPQAVMLDLKRKRRQTIPPMKQARRKHSCVRAKVNGRPGVIVAGGSSGKSSRKNVLAFISNYDFHKFDQFNINAVPALASMEFFDLREGRWLSLGRLREGRRYPGIFALAGNLVVAGGETTDPFGRTVIKDDMEILKRKTWRPVKQKLSEPRSRFAPVTIPRTFF